jgi:hypothetical protein
MSLILGTNCGFVLARPTANPGAAGDVGNISYNNLAAKFVAPAGASALTELGWYNRDTNDAANYLIGIFSHDSGNNRPGSRLAVSALTAKGTTPGWKYAAVSYALTPGTTYWVGVWVDAADSGVALAADYSASDKYDAKYWEDTLVTTWGSSSASETAIVALYALYTEGGASGQPTAKRWGGIPNNALGAKGRW